MAARPKLTDQDLRYLERAQRIRKKLTNKALAAKFGVHYVTVMNYLKGACMTIEEWNKKREITHEAAKIAPFTRGR